MKNWLVFVTVGVLMEEFELDPRDVDVEGTYQINVSADTFDEAVDAALHEFNVTCPIADPDNFEITTDAREER